METEQIVWPLRDAPALRDLVQYFCPTCRIRVEHQHVGIDVYAGRRGVIRQTLIINCPNCDARHVLPMQLMPAKSIYPDRTPNVVDTLQWTLEEPYICVYERFNAIFKLERSKNQ